MASLSFNCRELILTLQEKAANKMKSHELQAQLYLLRMELHKVASEVAAEATAPHATRDTPAASMETTKSSASPPPTIVEEEGRADSLDEMSVPLTPRPPPSAARRSSPAADPFHRLKGMPSTPWVMTPGMTPGGPDAPPRLDSTISSFGASMISLADGPSARGSILTSRQERKLRHVERKIGKCQASLLASKEKFAEHEKALESLIERAYECTGFAFVTFNSEAAAKKCIEEVNSTAGRNLARSYFHTAGSGRLGVTPAKLSAERPPEPEEVYWEQLQYKHAELLPRQFKASSLLGLVALAGTTLICLANYGMGPVMMHAATIGQRIGLQARVWAPPHIPLPHLTPTLQPHIAHPAVPAIPQAGFTVMIICGNVFIFILTPVSAAAATTSTTSTSSSPPPPPPPPPQILANVIERHYTFGGKELSCLCKMLGFQV